MRHCLLSSYSVSKIEVERASERVKVTVYAAKPGVIIGKGGAEIEKTKAELQKLTGKKILLDIKEIKRPDKAAKRAALTLLSATRKRCPVISI